MIKLTVISTLVLLGTNGFVGAIQPNLGFAGGQPTDISEHPWHVSIYYFDEFICSGALISDTWILTSGHCIYGRPIVVVSVYVGSSNRTGGQQYSAIDAIVYLEYLPDYLPHINDIALINISLSEPWNSDIVKPIDLPSDDEDVDLGTNATVTGWGKDTLNGTFADILQEYKFKVVSNDECVKSYGDPSVIDETMFCGGKDPCLGDIGDPVVVDGKLVGVYAYGTDCHYPERLGLFTKVSAYRNWIRYFTGL